MLSVLFCGCSALFQPTETPAYNFSNMIIDPSTSDRPASSSSSDIVSFVSTPEVNSSSSVPPISVSEPDTSAVISGDRHPRFTELEKRFSYDANGKICLSESEAAFADKALFVGDSICRGFTAYNVVKTKNVYAAGSVGARNFFDMEFQYHGKATGYDEVLEEVAPESVILSMGMNDVNMTSAQEYCENYRKIIDYTLEHSGANVYVCAITPINSNFAEHSRIDAFNLAMKNYIAENFGQRVAFIDFGYLLKNGDNMLSQGLDSGDGIHLAPECYFIAMLEICDQLGIN